jgi:hypothetical protein
LNHLLNGATRSLRGLRTGDTKSLYSGALLLAYGIWKRNRGRKDLVYRRTLKPGEAILVRANRVSGKRIVLSDELAEKLKRP